MPAMLLAPPAFEPVSLADMKTYLRLDHADEDGLVAAMITAARAACELATRRAFITQTWRLVRDRWPSDGVIIAPVSPLQSVAAVRTLAADGALSVLDPARLMLAAPDRILLPAGGMPAPGRAQAGIEIDVVAGYGASADAVPAPLREAVRGLAAHIYEHRGTPDVDGALPPTVSALLRPYRTVVL